MTKLPGMLAYCLLIALPAFAQTQVFFEPPQYATPGSLAVATGDFNGDGKLDLAAAGSCSPSSCMSILLGNGDGTFQTHVDYPVGDNPTSLAVADFNGDGRLDLVVTNQNSGSVSVLFGNGDGTFQPRQDYATGAQPISVAVADFNGDGKPDLAVANLAGHSVSIFLNSGNGTFPARRDFATASGLSFVTAGDFNNDGKVDLAVATGCGTFGCVSLLLGNGDGTFQVHADYAVGGNPIWLTAADLNGDGNLDLAVANRGDSGFGGSVTVLWGNGNGTFTAQDFSAGNNPISVVVGDFNGDGRLDFAVTNSTDETVSLFINQGQNSFSRAIAAFGTGGVPLAAAAGDFNRDQKLDLAVTCGGETRGVCILLGDGSGGFLQTPLSYPTGNGPTSVAVADLNRDNKNDVVVTNFKDNDVSVFLGNGDGTFQAGLTYATGTEPISVGIADFNHDGYPDLVVANLNANTVSVLLNNGNGTFQTHVDFPTASFPSSVAIGDINGDGKLDLVVACRESNSISILLGNGDGTFQAHADFGVESSPKE